MAQNGKRSEADLWLALSLIPGLGALTLARAWRQFSSASAVFAAGPGELSALGLRPSIVAEIAAFADWAQVDDIKNKVAAAKGFVVTFAEAEYPALLKEIADPPPVLYLAGNPDCLTRPGVSLVGARKASELGRRFAVALAEKLAARGLAVISGLALGVDGAAHQGALRVGGLTIAVLGTGLDVVYPPEHRHLSRQIREKGLLLSEFPPGTGPDKGHFPRRNRLVSGLAQGVVVVEAGERSGSLITARLALEQGREVLAVPGPPGVPGSRGVNRLLKEGAQLVDSADDIFTAMPWLSEKSDSQAGAPGATHSGKKPALSPDQAELLALFGSDAIDFDAILAELDWDSARLSRTLLDLELDGLIFKCTGSAYRRSPDFNVS